MTTVRSKPIYLCGMMGSGKSTTGRKLAGKLGLPHIDLDRQIEQRAGCSIPELFAGPGEARFRELERELLQETFTGGAAVISLGGGALQDSETVDSVKKAGTHIFLDAPLSVLLGRLQNDRSRPLLHAREKRDLETRIETLLEQRKPHYLRSHITVSAGRLTPESITDIIIEKLKENES